MLINTDDYVTIANYAKMRYNNRTGKKGVTPERIYQILDSLNWIDMDGVIYINKTNPHNVEKRRK